VRVDQLKPVPGSKKSRKRVGRGISAGGGKTAGRGQKGQGARSSWSLPRGFEGGQMPLTQRVPKLRGFYNRFRVEYQVVNCGKLARFEAGAVVDVEGLRKAGLVRHLNQPIKLLAGGGAPSALTIRVNRASRAALQVIAKAGGTVELLDAPKAEDETEASPSAAQRRRAAKKVSAQLASEQEEVAGDPEPGAEPAGGGQESST
jgi:large subunit ribosomal protein L15